MTKDARARTVVLGRGPQSEPEGQRQARPHSGEAQGCPRTQPKAGRQVTPQLEATTGTRSPWREGY